MKTSETFTIILIILIIGLVVFGLYRVSKRVSYNLWYKPMVEQTIREMIKPEYLND